MRSSSLHLRLVALVLLALASCGPGEAAVDLVFRPAVGARDVYELTVSSTVVTTLGGEREVQRDEVSLTVEEIVLDAEPAGRVRLGFGVARPGDDPLTFEVKLEREAGVAAVDVVEGLPLEVLGALGPSRLFPLAAGLLPGGPVRPGATWAIDRALGFPEDEGRLTGRGRLTGLRRRGGVPVAQVAVRAVLPVSRRMALREGTVTVAGDEVTVADIDYDVRDGTVLAARSVTTGRFDLAAAPPAAETRGAVLELVGSLEVTIESRVERRNPPFSSNTE